MLVDVVTVRYQDNGTVQLAVVLLVITCPRISSNFVICVTKNYFPYGT